jgi:asparagine synthetase B (glutamine-hydrolysing)
MSRDVLTEAVACRISRAAGLVSVQRSGGLDSTALAHLA